MLSSWEDGDHFKCMVYLPPGNEGSVDHNAGVDSHSSG